MTIYEGDLAILRGRSSIVPSIMGQQELVFANQSASFLPVIELEVSLLDPGTRQRVTTWARVQCNVFKGYANSESSRLDGPWLRYMLYTATAPRNDNRMIVGNVYSDVINLLPNTDRLLPRPPAYMGLHSPGRRISLRPSGTAPIGDLAEDPKPVMTEGDIPGPGVAHKTAKAAPTAPKVVI